MCEPWETDMSKDKIRTYLKGPMCLLSFEFFFSKMYDILQIEEHYSDFPLVLAGAHDASRPIMCKWKYLIDCKLCYSVKYMKKIHKNTVHRHVFKTNNIKVN